MAAQGKARVKSKGQPRSFMAYFHGLKPPHTICDIWPQWREFGERARSGGRLGRKTQRNTIKYVQLSGKISICQLFVFFLVFLDSQEIACVHTCACACVCVTSALEMGEEAEKEQDLSEGELREETDKSKPSFPPSNVQMQTMQAVPSRWKVFCFLVFSLPVCLQKRVPALAG